MKKLIALLLSIAVCSTASLAFAGDESKPQAEKKTAKKDAPQVIVRGGIIDVGPDGKIKVQPLGGESKSKQSAVPELKMETFHVGRVITVGPDGKIETHDLNGALPKDVLDKLPKELRDHLLKGPAATAGDGHGVGGKMKIVVMKDGQRREYRTDLSREEAFKLLSSGSFDEILKHVGDKLPPEEKEALKEALTATPQAMMAGGQRTHSPMNGQEEIISRLDKILDRLDRLEQEVKALKEDAEPKE